MSQDILQSIRDLSVELASAIHDNNLTAAQPVVDKLNMLADALATPPVTPPTPFAPFDPAAPTHEGGESA